MIVPFVENGTAIKVIVNDGCNHRYVDPFANRVGVGAVCPDCWCCTGCGADLSLNSHLHPRIHSCYFTSKQVYSFQGE